MTPYRLVNSYRFDIYMSKGYFIIVWPCAPSCKIVTSELIPLFFFRNVDLGTRYVTACVVSLIAGRSWGKLSALFLQPIQNRGLWLRSDSIKNHASRNETRRIAAMRIIFTRISCTLFTCDMYMCRIRHINDPVLLSLKMEGIRLLFSEKACCLRIAARKFRSCEISVTRHVRVMLRVNVCLCTCCQSVPTTYGHQSSEIHPSWRSFSTHIKTHH
jgi:hypothetical protein